MNKPPSPGSDAAVAEGCLCPVMDNSRGAGAYGDGETFWVNQSCPLHASPAYAELLKAVGADKESSE